MKEVFLVIVCYVMLAMLTGRLAFVYLDKIEDKDADFLAVFLGILWPIVILFSVLIGLLYSFYWVISRPTAAQHKRETEKLAARADEALKNDKEIQ